MVEGGIREFVDDTDRPAFLERELVGVWMGTVRSEFMTMQVERCPITHLENILPLSPM